MTAQRLRILLPAAGLIAGLVLAVTPQWYRSPGGYQGEKVGHVESQLVGCGITFWPKNPPAPPGTDDMCDAQHTRRGAMVVIVVLLGFTLGAIVALGDRLARRSRSGPA